jgi:hypothetical protein
MKSISKTRSWQKVTRDYVTDFLFGLLTVVLLVAFGSVAVGSDASKSEVEKVAKVSPMAPKFKSPTPVDHPQSSFGKPRQDARSSDCYWQYYYQNVAYYWRVPHPVYGDLAYAMRYSVAGPETLMTVDVAIYDPGDGTFGNDTVLITVYDDASGLPGTQLAQVILPAGTYPSFPAWTTADFSSFNLVMTNDFHVSFSSTAAIGVDYESCLSSDGTDGVGRSTCFSGEIWYSMSALWGIDCNFLFDVYLCREAGTPIPGISFAQVDFTFSNANVPNSDWGRLEVDAATVLNDQGFPRGYLQAYIDSGWVIQNLQVDTSHVDTIAVYFDLFVDLGVDITSLSAHVELTSEPVSYFTDGPRVTYPVDVVQYNAEGSAGEMQTTAIPEPPKPIDEFNPEGLTYSKVKPNVEGENVQTAMNQCAPMAIANSLQYLENRYGINIPHDHKPGIRGDNSLVGQLDEHMKRVRCTPLDADGNCTCPAGTIPIRTDGCGVYVKEMVDGKFSYLKANGLGNKLVQKHQGYHHCPNPGPNEPGRLPAGDYTDPNTGITSKDASVNGKVTFDWLYAQVDSCEDVEVIYCYEDEDGNCVGAHAVRIFGAGKTLGVPWLKYKDDAEQTDTDPNDEEGLEEAQVFVSDLDGDGMPNFGSIDQEITFALSESPCCNHDGIRGDVDMSGSINVADVTYLVAYLKGLGPAPPCFEEGDIDGGGTINVADVTYLVAYLKGLGPAPPQCP